jgi:P4 family phage/plasmid primase-like protien
MAMTAKPHLELYTSAQQGVVEPPRVDLAVAEAFLSIFGERHTFQTFDETKSGNRELAKVLHGGAEQLDTLHRLNARGAGVFFTVSQTDLQGRKAENVTAVRALFLDLDGAPLAPVLDAAKKGGVVPHLVIESSPDRFHVYWRVTGVSLDQFTPAQKALAHRFGGDTKVHDLPRVMRVPGFLHQKVKEQRFLTVQREAHPGSLYTLRDLVSGLGLELGAAAPLPANDFTDEGGAIIEGGRNDTLASRAGYMRRGGMNQEVITAALLAENRSRCHPPLSESEVRTIAKSIGKYQPDARASLPVLGYLEIEQKIADTDDKRLLSGQVADLITFSQMRQAEKQTLRKRISEKTGVSVAVLLADARDIDEAGESHFAAAKAAIGKLGAENLIFAQGSFWRWKGKVWASVDDREIKRTVHAVSGDSELTGSVVTSVVDLIKTECFRPDQVFDAASEVINCANGELVHANGQWRLGEHLRDRYLTTVIPVEYDPAARAPRFNQFLFEVFEGDCDACEKIELLGEAFGYSLIPSCHLEKFFLLIGSGANGKSVLLNVLKALLGVANVAAVKPSQFNNNFQRAYLQGKLANIVSEIEIGTQLADGLKALTSGESMTAERKHRDPFTFTPIATQWMGTNHFPQVSDLSGGFVRRAAVLTFNQHFVEGQRDVHLAEKLKAELPGILNFALEGLERLYRNSQFTIPESSDQAMRRWLSEVDQVSQFVEEGCTEGAALEVESGALYVAYRDWAVGAGIQRLVSHKSFTSRLESRGFGRARGGGGVRMIAGLTINEQRNDFYTSAKEQ